MCKIELNEEFDRVLIKYREDKEKSNSILEKTYIDKVIYDIERLNLHSLRFLQPCILTFRDKQLSIEELNQYLNDPYFEGLELNHIFELAKKSIRLTKENSELQQKISKLLEE